MMDLICYSHLRWNFVYQRPQHLLSRFASHYRIFFIEEPIFGEPVARLDAQQNEDQVWVLVPHLPHGLAEEQVIEVQNQLLRPFFADKQLQDYIAWYYTPMAIELNPGVDPILVVYDCMDELSAFKNAPAILTQRGDQLMQRADVVFTGGSSLYAARKDKHHNVYLFPSSIDRKHFGKAMQPLADPADQEDIAGPRIGFFGVIDERMDIALLEAVAKARPEWQLVVLGPVVKIDPGTLPSLPNIHYLGQKSYQELPAYLANWDVAMMPFAINESTKFISPTKTPEYLAAGKPVVSTPIKDVVDGYGKTGLVYIAEDAGEFVDKIEAALHIKDRTAWLAEVDKLLAQGSWDRTVEQMLNYINAALSKVAPNTTKEKEDAYV